MSVLHRLAGNVFVTAVLVMSAIGAALAPFLPTPERASVIAALMRGAVFTFSSLTGSPSGLRMAPRSTKSATAWSRPRYTASCSSTPQPS